MENTFAKLIQGYQTFRKKYATGDQSIMRQLADHGQKPEIMIVACCDSRVDPSLILQCDPGDLFIVRNVANIVPPYESNEGYRGTTAAIEFAVCYLKVKHLIILGHSQCGGIAALTQQGELDSDDFITRWASIVDDGSLPQNSDEAAKHALSHSYQNCLSFPWLKERIDQEKLTIHQWFFDIKAGEIFAYSRENDQYQALTHYQ